MMYDIKQMGWAEKVTNAVGLGVGVGLMLGGGARSFGSGLPVAMMALFTPNQNPKYASIFAGVLGMGSIMSPLLDQGNAPSHVFFKAMPLGLLTGVVAWLFWRASQTLIQRMKARGFDKDWQIWGLVPVYLVAYILVTLGLASLINR